MGAVSAPVLTTMLRSEPITGTVVSLQGTASLDPVVNTPTSLSGMWVRQDSLAEILIMTASDNTTLTFDPLKSIDSDVYVYMVTVTPDDSTYVEANNNSQSFPLTVRPYPDLDVGTDILSGVCDEGGTTLLSSLTLLANTHPSHTLTYMWTDPGGRGITESSDDFTLMSMDSELRVNSLEGNMGEYELQVCLTIPGTDVVDHCSDTLTYAVSTAGKLVASRHAAYITSASHACVCLCVCVCVCAVPGQVQDLMCDATEATVLPISWTPPTVNTDAVNDYVVVVKELVQSQGSTELQAKELDPSFKNEVGDPGDEVTAGVGRCVWSVLRVADYLLSLV